MSYGHSETSGVSTSVERKQRSENYDRSLTEGHVMLDELKAIEQELKKAHYEVKGMESGQYDAEPVRSKYSAGP